MLGAPWHWNCVQKEKKKSHRAASSERQQKKKKKEESQRAASRKLLSASSERQQKKKKNSASSERQQKKQPKKKSQRAPTSVSEQRAPTSVSEQRAPTTKKKIILYYDLRKKKKKKKKKRSAHRVLPGSDRNSADWTQWNKKTEAAILCQSYTVLLNVPFFFTPEASSCMGAWSVGGPRTWSRQLNHRRWPPWPSRRQKAPQHHTTPTFSKVGQHSCLFISVENAFRVHKALTQSLFAQFGATAPISVLQTPTKTPRGPSTKDSDATGLIKRPEINTKTSLPREHERVLERQRR